MSADRSTVKCFRAARAWAALALVSGICVAAEPIPALNVARYMGQWHQVAHYPNRFQQHCLSDTTATYRLLQDESIEVTNRCKIAGGGVDTAVGLGRPRGAKIEAGELKPASLEVTFLPAWLRWLPVGWGSYDVIWLAPDERVAIVSEPSKTYLWVLARDRRLDAPRWQDVTGILAAAGFDLARLARDGDTAEPTRPGGR